MLFERVVVFDWRANTPPRAKLIATTVMRAALIILKIKIRHRVGLRLSFCVKIARDRSGGQALDEPFLLAPARVAKTIVQTIRATLPELNRLWV